MGLLVMHNGLLVVAMLHFILQDFVSFRVVA